MPTFEDRLVHRAALSPAEALLVREDAARFERIAAVLRLVLAGVGLLAMVANWETNSTAAMQFASVPFAIALGWAAFVYWRVKNGTAPGWSRYASAVVDMCFVTAFSASGLYNESGAYETLLAPIFIVLYPMFIVLTALSGSVFATLLAGFAASAGRFLLLEYVVDRGLVVTSEAAVYGQAAVGLTDQYTIVGFLGVLGGLFAGMAWLLRRESIRGAQETVRKVEAERRQAHYRKYLSANVADFVMTNPGAMALGGQRAEATVVFVDIRDFTPFSEGQAPEMVVEVLNRVFSVLVEIVFRHGGTLDKFLGDGLMAVFGVPKPMEDPCGEAVGAALEMMTAIRDLNAADIASGHPLRIGVGIAHGDVVAGNVGSPDRMEFTVIGDTVNYASRLQGLCKDFAQDIVVSEPVYEAIAARFDTMPMPKVRIKGKSGEPNTWAVTGARL